jgi:hypothetical protein
MRSVLVVLAGVSLASASLPAVAQSTTRIETRTFYGATVTVEEGVRVIRPLPRGRVMVKADGKELVSPGSSQPDTCACNRTYLHRIGDETASVRYIRRVLETQPLSGPR